MKKLLFTLVILFGCANMSFAAMGAYDAGTMNTQYMRDLRIHEASTRAKAKNDAIIQTKRQALEKTQQQTPTSSALINSIVFINNNSISSTTLLNVIQKRLNQPMTPENIALIRKDIMRFYQENGYYSVLVMVTSQDPQNGEVVFEITEGGRNSIQIQD